jgi:hypothetical protein
MNIPVPVTGSCAPRKVPLAVFVGLGLFRLSVFTGFLAFGIRHGWHPLLLAFVVMFLIPLIESTIVARAVDRIGLIPEEVD